MSEDARGAVALPAWAVVTDRRRAHIERVVALADGWATALGCPPEERRAWHDAAQWHDAVRDAPEALLRSWAGDATAPAGLLHGPAAAARLAADGERRTDVLDAIRWHTVGFVGWGRTGRALYMADFLEPGRPFAAVQRAFLARQAPRDFDGTFREVVRMRLHWVLRDGKDLGPETTALWNSLR